MPVSDTIQPGLRSQPCLNPDLPSLPTCLACSQLKSQRLSLTCKGMEGSIPPMWQAATPVLAVATVPVGGSEPRIRFSR